MATITVKEIKDDAIISIEINKSFYFMVKSALFYLFKDMPDPESQREERLKGIMEKDYKDMTHWEQSFYTLTLLLAEIEKQAVNNNLYVDTEVAVPDEPTKD